MLSHLCFPETLQVLRNICVNVSTLSCLLAKIMKAMNVWQDYQQPLV
jgi:hypothetical protein